MSIGSRRSWPDTDRRDSGSSRGEQMLNDRIHELRFKRSPGSVPADAFWSWCEMTTIEWIGAKLVRGQSAHR